MGQLESWALTAIAIGGLVGTLVTAIATIFLWRVTKLLAVETERMAKATSQPHIVATLEPNRWSMRHFDLKVDNTGNATAYDIIIEFDPPLQNGEARTSGIEIPFGKVSVLKPGQCISSHLSDYSLVKEKVYSVHVRWRRSASDLKIEENVYTLNMADQVGVSQLGSDPAVEIASHLKKMEKELKAIAGGSARIRIDAFTGGDRLHERRVAARRLRALNQKQSQ